MIKKNKILFLLLLSPVFIQSYAHNHQQRHQALIDACKNARGKQLVLYIQQLKSHDQKELLQRLTPEQRQDFFKSLSTPEQYSNFLDMYNEYDWKRLRVKLSNEEKKHYPKTVHAQRVAVVMLIHEAKHGGRMYQRFSFVVDLLPYGKNIRTNLESSTDQSIKNSIQEKFITYMKEKFAV